MSPDLEARLRAIRLVAFDVDGVLTDGRLRISASGDETKSFHVRDGLGIVLARHAGLAVAFVSGRRSAAVDRRAKDLGLPEDLNVSAAGDKARALRRLSESMRLPLDAIAFVGDDLNDLPALATAGLAVAVADAAPEAKDAADMVLEHPGGGGAAREIVEIVLRSQGKWDAGILAYLDAIGREAPGDTGATAQ